MTSRTLIWTLAATLLLATTLTACGQKGPLYLPDTDQDQVQQKEKTE